MEIKVDIIHVPIYVIEDNTFATTVKGVHPQQVKWFNNCVKDFWKAQQWLQQVKNETSNPA